MLCRVLASKNYCRSKYFGLELKAKRMSGEMNTSLGNGFSNLMFILFGIQEYKLQATMPVVEGDDGLFGVIGELPGKHFLDLGLTVKMERHESINTASFCGLIFDLSEKIIVTEPLKVLARFGWYESRYNFASREVLLGLMKSKALSVCWQYPGCPIIYKYAVKLLSLLDDIEIYVPIQNTYDRERFDLEAIAHYKFPLVMPGPRTRHLMWDKFGVSISDQLAIESEIDNITLADLGCPTAFLLYPQCWKDYYSRFVRTYDDMPADMVCYFDRIGEKKNIYYLKQLPSQ
jgi:hypothetical protein